MKLNVFASLPAIDGVWSQWSTWTVCSKSCDTGTQTRERTCTNPAPANGGQACQGDSTQAQKCNTISCLGGGSGGGEGGASGGSYGKTRLFIMFTV